MTMNGSSAAARLAVLFLSLAASCVSVSKEYPDIHSFVLDAHRSGEKGALAVRENLIVRRLRISPRFETQSFVYRTDEHAFESDFYNDFLVAPDQLITEEVRDWLRRSGLFLHVLTPDSRADAELVLEGNIVALYGDYSKPREPMAVIELQLFLIREPGGASEVLLERSWHREVLMTGDRPADLVAGWNQGLTAILQGLEATLANIDVDG